MEHPYSEVMRVRFRDTDAQAHMFFANYLVFADEVSGRYTEQFGLDWSHPENFPCFVFVANASCDFIHECRAGDDVRVECAYERFGNSSATLGYRLIREGDEQLLARGSFTHVFVDKETRKPSAIPPRLREALENKLVALSGKSD